MDYNISVYSKNCLKHLRTRSENIMKTVPKNLKTIYVFECWHVSLIEKKSCYIPTHMNKLRLWDHMRCSLTSVFNIQGNVTLRTQPHKGSKFVKSDTHLCGFDTQKSKYENLENHCRHRSDEVFWPPGYSGFNSEAKQCVQPTWMQKALEALMRHDCRWMPKEKNLRRKKIIIVPPGRTPLRNCCVP